MNDFLSELKRRVLVYDGAMGTNVQRHNLTAEDFWGKEIGRASCRERV